MCETVGFRSGNYDLPEYDEVSVPTTRFAKRGEAPFKQPRICILTKQHKYQPDKTGNLHNMDDLREFAKVCEQAVRRAGATILDWVGRFEVYKKGPSDLVTQADLAAQEAVRSTVLEAFPDHGFVGEEGPPGGADAPGGYRWIVDPLDGTTNYAHGVPHFAVSLALERQGEILVGAIFDPNRGEYYMAIRGQGATLNGKPLKTSGVLDLADAIGAVGFPYDLRPDSPDLLVFNTAVFRCQSVRRTGCTSLNLAYLAAGRFDVYWAYGTHIWDVAAGVLLIREAGGVVTAPDGGPFDIRDAKLLAAATEPLHAQLRQMAAEALAGR